MRILLVVAFVAAVCGVQCANQLLSKLEKSNRQKRLLFYDDQGHLMKNYANTLYHVGPKTQENLFQWSFLNTFLSPIFPNLGRTSIAYMVPVSDAIVQQINKDPIYQNKLLYLTYLDPIVQANPLCNGKRTQIPSSNLCNNYVNCWDGWGFEQECPPGLLFSTDGFCDYPMNVNCHNRKLKNPNPLCDNDFQATVNSANCNEFFICVNSIPVRFKCPGDLAFSERLGVCDFPNRVDCNSTNDAILSPSNPQIVQLSTQASPVNAPVTPGPVVQGAPMVGDKNMAINKLEYNTQTWSSTHMAISRQDAIRQLKLGSIDEASMKN